MRELVVQASLRFASIVLGAWTFGSAAMATEPAAPVAIGSKLVGSNCKVEASIKVTNQSVVTAGGAACSQISGTNVECEVLMRCALIESDPGGTTPATGLFDELLCSCLPGQAPDPPGELESVKLTKIEVNVGGQTIVKELAQDYQYSLYPFEPGQKVRAVKFRFRMASTFYKRSEGEMLTPFRAVGTFKLAYVGESEQKTETANSQDLPVKICNKALLFATKEYYREEDDDKDGWDEDDFRLMLDGSNPLIDPQPEPIAALAACGMVAPKVEQHPVNHSILGNNYDGYTKEMLVGTSTAPGVLRTATLVFAMTHGVFDVVGQGAFDANKLFGFRPSLATGYPILCGQWALSEEVKESTISTRVPALGSSSECYNAVYGSRQDPRKPPVNLAIMYICNGIPFSDPHGLGGAFGVVDEGLAGFTVDRACIGFATKLRARLKNPAPGDKGIEYHAAKLVELLSEGRTADDAIRRVKKQPGLQWMPLGKVEGDPLSRLAYVYLTKSDWDAIIAGDPKNEYKKWWHQLELGEVREQQR